MQNNYYIPFTKEMKSEYTILIPNMLPHHFKLIRGVFRQFGYKPELLETTGQQIRDKGLAYTHNDACYPAILVIGQFIEAIESGRYDPHKVALMMFQTGGGCRASNYISLIRKAVERAGYGYVPVISLSFAGIEKHPGFQLTLPLLHKLVYAVLYGDLMLTLINQVKPYEINKGDANRLADDLTERLAKELTNGSVNYHKSRKAMRRIIEEFAAIPVKEEKKVRVGIVGEIFVKFSPLGNNNLEQFLVDEGAEVVMPGLLDFFMYCVYNNMTDMKYYGLKKSLYPIIKLGYNILLKVQADMNSLIKENGRFRPGTPFSHTVKLTKGYISHGCKMGEGWLLTAEMLELAESGTKNIVCTQPFGCLPNHIAGKGMMNPIKQKNPDVNIIAIDYDAGASEINQQNRIKLMLENAKSKM